MLNVFMLTFIMLTVIMLAVIIMSVIMLSVVAPETMLPNFFRCKFPFYGNKLDRLSLADTYSGSLLRKA
jgi:hypothetical protein